jgi:hypothetical protein
MVAATQVNESGAAVLVTWLLAVMCAVIRRLRIEDMRHDMLQLLGKLHRRQDGKQDEQRDKSHSITA